MASVIQMSDLHKNAHVIVNMRKQIFALLFYAYTSNVIEKCGSVSSMLAQESIPSVFNVTLASI